MQNMCQRCLSLIKLQGQTRLQTQVHIEHKPGQVTLWGGAGRLPANEMRNLLHHNLLNLWQNNKGDTRMAQGIAAFLPLYSYSKLT